MTNHHESEQWSSQTILETYKGQDAAETSFRLLKDPAILDAVYLKRPSRIETLVTVFIMALLVYGILEWRVHENLAKEQRPILIPGQSKTLKPTGEMLLTLLKTIQVIMDDDRLIRRLSDHIRRKC
jgi:transposase